MFFKAATVFLFALLPTISFATSLSPSPACTRVSKPTQKTVIQWRYSDVDTDGYWVENPRPPNSRRVLIGTPPPIETRLIQCQELSKYQKTFSLTPPAPSRIGDKYPTDPTAYKDEKVQFVDSDGDGWFIAAPSSLPPQKFGPTGFLDKKYALTNPQSGLDCNPENKEAYKSYQTMYKDEDKDLFTVVEETTVCAGSSLPFPYVDTASSENDCDDKDPAENKKLTYVLDSDGDLFRDSSYQFDACKQNKETNWLLLADSKGMDCAPGDANLFAIRSYHFKDADKDQYFSPSNGEVCSGLELPAGYLSELGPRPLDCDDNDGSIQAPLLALMDKDRDRYHDSDEKQQVCPNALTDQLLIPSQSLGLDCDPASSTKFKNLAYSFRDSDLDGYFVTEAGTICSGSTLPTGFSDQSPTTGADCNDKNPKLLTELSYAFVDEDGDSLTVPKQGKVCSGKFLPAGYSDIASNPVDTDDTQHFSVTATPFPYQLSIQSSVQFVGINLSKYLIFETPELGAQGMNLADGSIKPIRHNSKQVYSVKFFPHDSSGFSSAPAPFYTYKVLGDVSEKTGFDFIRETTSELSLWGVPSTSTFIRGGDPNHYILTPDTGGFFFTLGARNPFGLTLPTVYGNAIAELENKNIANLTVDNKDSNKLSFQIYDRSLKLVTLTGTPNPNVVDKTIKTILGGMARGSTFYAWGPSLQNNGNTAVLGFDALTGAKTVDFQIPGNFSSLTEVFQFKNQTLFVFDGEIAFVNSGSGPIRLNPLTLEGESISLPWRNIQNQTPGGTDTALITFESNGDDGTLAPSPHGHEFSDYIQLGGRFQVGILYVNGQNQISAKRILNSFEPVQNAFKAGSDYVFSLGRGYFHFRGKSASLSLIGVNGARTSMKGTLRGTQYLFNSSELSTPFGSRAAAGIKVYSIATGRSTDLLTKFSGTVPDQEYLELQSDISENVYALSYSANDPGSRKLIKLTTPIGRLIPGDTNKDGVSDTPSSRLPSNPDQPRIIEVRTLNGVTSIAFGAVGLSRIYTVEGLNKTTGQWVVLSSKSYNTAQEQVWLDIVGTGTYSEFRVTARIT